MKTAHHFLILYLFGNIAIGQTIHEDVYSNPKAVANKLNDSYHSKDFELFDSFFQSWHQWSIERDTVANKSSTAFIDSLFQAVYYPFDFTQYGWKKRKSDRTYPYTILQTTVPISYKDSIYTNALDSLKSIKYNGQIREFYSSIDIKGSKNLFDDPYYGSVLRMFLATETAAKNLFLENWIRQAQYPDTENYLTAPVIIGFCITNEKKQAIAHLKLNTTEFFILLTKTDQSWKKEILPFRMIKD